MSNYEERHTVDEVRSGPRPMTRAIPEPVVVVEEREGMSGLAIAVIVAAAIAATTLIVYLIINNQQQNRDAQQAKDQIAQSQLPQPQSQPAQQPLIVTVPQSQPAAAAPVAPPVAPPSGAGSSSSIDNAQADLNSKLLRDDQLSAYSVNASVDNGIATLSGDLPSSDLKMRAEQVAKSVKGVSAVINHISVQSNN
jgi:hyperosmotically inducible periplasmic protein